MGTELYVICGRKKIVSTYGHSMHVVFTVIET